MFRLIYQIGIQLLIIYFKIADLIGNSKAKAYNSGRKQWKETLSGLHKDKSTYWIHAASHGEGLMAIPLIEKLLEKKECQIVISFFSPSGYKNFKYSNKNLFKIFLPIDTIKNAKEIIKIIQPKHLVFVKYDLWMNLIIESQKNDIPISIFSAKFHQKQWYFNPFSNWAKNSLQNISNILTIDKESKDFLNSKEFKNVIYCGDTRYDQVNTEISKPEININKPCLIVGSSWEKEEQILSNVINDFPNIQFLIAPHEIDNKRLNEVRSHFGSKSKFYSEIDLSKELPNVLIIDKIGLLADLYSISDIAFIGGGFTGKLHNIIEPAAKGNTIIFGPNHEKYPEAKLMLDEEIAYIIKDKFDLIKILKSIENHKNRKEKSINFVLKNKGASEVVYKTITQTN